jgi:hypothetical protein
MEKRLKTYVGMVRGYIIDLRKLIGSQPMIMAGDSVRRQRLGNFQPKRFWFNYIFKYLRKIANRCTSYQVFKILYRRPFSF